MTDVAEQITWTRPNSGVPFGHVPVVDESIDLRSQNIWDIPQVSSPYADRLAGGSSLVLKLAVFVEESQVDIAYLSRYPMILQTTQLSPAFPPWPGEGRA